MSLRLCRSVPLQEGAGLELLLCNVGWLMQKEIIEKVAEIKRQTGGGPSRYILEYL